MTSPLPIEVFVSTSRFDRQNLRTADALSGGRLRYTFNPHGRKLTEEETSHVLSEGFMGLIASLESLSESVLSAAISFLTSTATSYINGHNLVVDGGLTTW